MSFAVHWDLTVCMQTQDTERKAVYVSAKHAYTHSLWVSFVKRWIFAIISQISHSQLQ